MKQKVVYIGTSHTIIEAIINHPSFELQQVICEAKRIKEIHQETYNRFQIRHLPFENKEHFIQMIETFKNQEIVFVIYQLDMIVPESLTSKYRFFNLHAGNMATNRGAHPIIRSVLNGDTESELTLHEINAKIDQGTVVATFPVEIDKEDTPETIKEHMESGIPYLLNQLHRYLKREFSGVEATGGIYYKPVSEKDFTIHLWEDSKETIKNKIRSQAQYFGAIVSIDNQHYRVDQLLDWQRIENQERNIEITDTTIHVNRSSVSFKLNRKNS